MSLADKYKIPKDVVKQMYYDGWISASAIRYDEIAATYKRQIAEGRSKSEALHNTSEICRVCERVVYRALKKFD